MLDLDMRETPEGVVLAITVQPRSSRSELAGIRGGYLRIRCSALPEGGKANQQCLELLAEKLGIAPSRMAIIRGRSSRSKSVLLRGLTADQVSEKLQS